MKNGQNYQRQARFLYLRGGAVLGGGLWEGAWRRCCWCWRCSRTYRQQSWKILQFLRRRSPMMNWTEFSLSLQLTRSLRFTDRLTEKYFIVRAFASYMRSSTLASSRSPTPRHEQGYYLCSLALRSKSCSSCSRFSGLGIADCERRRTTAARRPLSLGQTLRKCTTERQSLMTGTAWQKQLKCRSLVCSTSSPLMAISLRSSRPRSGEPDFSCPTAKSLSISWYDTVRLLRPLRGTIRQAASSRSPLALQNLASFLAVPSRWHSHTTVAQLCSTFQLLAASSSTASSCQKQCSSITKLADSATTVSFFSAGRPMNRFLSRQWLLRCGPSSSSSGSCDCGRLRPFSSVRQPSSLRASSPRSRLASSLRSSAGWRRAIWAMLSVSRMLSWSLLRCEREVRSLALSAASDCASLFFSFSTRWLQQWSRERLTTGAGCWCFRQTMLTLLMLLLWCCSDINLLLMEDYQRLIIDIIGWVYFFAWSFSFYGQIYENFRHKSVEGMNFDFVAMNLTGFTFYSIYCTYGYFVSTDQTGQVDLNDLLFAYHALFATLLTLSQVLFFPKKHNKLHGVTILYLLLLWTFVVVFAILTQGTKTITVGADAGVVSLMGYFKLSISFLKYLPQFYWNYQRKSTKGWSIANIILDLTGGLLSFAQMALEAIFGQDVKINVVKLVLGIMVVFYDIGFIVQHYCLYPQSRQTLAIVSSYEKPASTTESLQASLLPIKEEAHEHEQPEAAAASQ